jgi:hypothetical protein
LENPTGACLFNLLSLIHFLGDAESKCSLLKFVPGMSALIQINAFNVILSEGLSRVHNQEQYKPTFAKPDFLIIFRLEL